MRPTRTALLSRIAAGVLGSYAAASLGAAALAFALPLPGRDAVTLAQMTGFLIFTAAIIWAFSAQSAARAWAGIGIPVIVSAALLAILLALRS
ncbi:hypothetical protein [Pacificimonas flava]|uniref:Iron uptake protein n=1 Tax=Pacificimonas flava TaxID=1234595 RepID=M2SBY6_9SPHN|nr:hypothetical protein [Pacificimonas flava]EMD82855.1 iron uptake protein [Pacificimonas flava]MBB5279469.1 hypothetical protein [Pacificimonas flava]